MICQAFSSDTPRKSILQICQTVPEAITILGSICGLKNVSQIHQWAANDRVEDKNVQQNLNMFRKAAINLIRQFKARTKSRKAISNIMLDCLLDYSLILRVVSDNSFPCFAASFFLTFLFENGILKRAE